jgi:hypothetical protein
VIYFHPDGDRHFVHYTPKHQGELTYDERPEP